MYSPSYYDSNEGVGFPTTDLSVLNWWVIFGMFTGESLVGESVMVVCELSEFNCECRGAWVRLVFVFGTGLLSCKGCLALV